ncbi:MAG: DUF3854 domain-containing protein [Acidobacteria bacterium]|nr:DUF3854 domain-containing protein [Acidobacteriota bacterium]
MPHSLGYPLTDADYRKLEKESWITRELANAAGIFRVTSQQGADIVVRKNTKDYSGIVFPYTEPGTGRIRGYRLRRDNPKYEYRPDGTRKEIDKYLTAPGDSNRLYFPPSVSSALLADTTVPVVIPEGEKKTLALWRLAHYHTDKPRFLPVGISGVFNWRGRVGREPGPDGKLHDVKGPIPDLDLLTWKNRKVVLLFDSDASRKDEVRLARRKLAEELERRG